MFRINCPICQSSNLKEIIDLGLQPLADSFLPNDVKISEFTVVPLQVLRCEQCTHMFNAVETSPALRYQGVPYSYTTGNSTLAVNHFQNFAKQVKLSVSDRINSVIDIGGNDGTLLSAFKSLGANEVLNIEPSKNIAQLSRSNGIPTLNAFFTASNAASNDLKADVIVSANVLNHADDLNDFMKGIRGTLAEDGMFVFQVPYATSMLIHGYFETIYHEHVNYFTAFSIKKLLEQFGFYVCKMEQTDYMCDSIRIFCKIGSNPHDRDFMDLMQDEIEQGLFDRQLYDEFKAKAILLRDNLRLKIAERKKRGQKIVGFCAATKANTLLNYVGINSSDIDCIADVSEHKWDKKMPGSLIRIVDEKSLDLSKYDAAIILAENLTNFMLPKLENTKLEIIRIR